jgi:hypothetical protein
MLSSATWANAARRHSSCPTRRPHREKDHLQGTA